MKKILSFIVVFFLASISSAFAVPMDLLISESYDDASSSQFETNFGEPDVWNGQLILNSNNQSGFCYEQVEYSLSDTQSIYDRYRIEMRAAVFGLDLANIGNSASIMVDAPMINSISFINESAYYRNYAERLTLEDGVFYDIVIEMDLAADTFLADFDGVGALSGVFANSDYLRSIRLGVSGYNTGGLLSLVVDDFKLYGEASAPVPEPATMLLFGGGLLAIAGIRKKFK